MKRPSLATVLALAALVTLRAAPLGAQTSNVTLAIDPGHSSAEFKVQHLVVANVRGTIPIAAGSVETAAGATLPVSVVATLDATGLDTQNADRDKDLRGPDWFDVAKYPTILFKSTKVVAGQGGSFKLSGDLTLHGVTKSVVLDCSTVGSTVDGRGHRHIGYSATTSVDRRDYGMNVLKSNGGNLIAGTSVAISLEIEAAER